MFPLQLPLQALCGGGHRLRVTLLRHLLDFKFLHLPLEALLHGSESADFTGCVSFLSKGLLQVSFETPHTLLQVGELLSLLAVTRLGLLHEGCGDLEVTGQICIPALLGVQFFGQTIEVT